MRQRAARREPVSRSRLLVAALIALLPAALALLGVVVAVRTLAGGEAPGSPLVYALSATAFIAMMLGGAALGFYGVLRERAGFALLGAALILVAAVPLGLGGQFVFPWLSAVALVALSRRWSTFGTAPASFARALGALAIAWLAFSLVEAFIAGGAHFAPADALYFPELVALAGLGLWPVRRAGVQASTA